MAPFPEPPAESPLPPEMRAAFEMPHDDVDLELLRFRGLMVPVAGVDRSKIPDTFNDPRDGGRKHEAVDILAPRGTPVLAADDGVIVRVGTNQLGGNVIWQTDDDHHVAYYYAHLDRYARGLREGQQVRRGEVIGYVGTTGNAPANMPHLHFQAMRLFDSRRYNDGPPFNPISYFVVAGVAGTRQ